jgi:two-component system CheB/CheR fusion protein
VAVLDEDLRVDVWSRGAEDLWGVRSEEVVGTPFLDLDIGLSLGGLEDSIRSVAGGVGVLEKVVEAVDRRGKALRCRVVCQPLLSQEMSLTGVVVTMERVS